MFFAAYTKKMAVSSRQIEFDGGVASVHLCTCNTPVFAIWLRIAIETPATFVVGGTENQSHSITTSSG